MTDLEAELSRVLEQHAFSGVLRVDRAGSTLVELAAGYAERGMEVRNRTDTVFGLASVAKGPTAVTVLSLVEDGLLDTGTRARDLLGEDLPEIDDRVTVEHLLAHRSGIGDYFDEEDESVITDYVMTVPVHRLATTADYLAVLEGRPQKFPPGDRFSYCNSGYVVLALLAERAAGRSFHDLVADRVVDRAGMTDTAFLRSDELPGRAARGYLHADGLRTNVLHLPVRGSGDGGIYGTPADLHRFWDAFLDGRLVSAATVARMLQPHSDVPEEDRRYGWGFWLHRSRDTVLLEGYDAGVSCRSVHDPSSDTTFTVVSNTSDGAWPVARHVGELLLG